MTRLLVQVIDLETGSVCDLTLSDHDDALLVLQRDRHIERGVPDDFARWLSSAISAALPDRVDYDLRAPSPAQISFATAMARSLGLALPADVLRYRGCMHEFLSANKEAFNQCRMRGRTIDGEVS